jgi:hypothetical protein
VEVNGDGVGDEEGNEDWDRDRGSKDEKRGGRKVEVIVGVGIGVGVVKDEILGVWVVGIALAVETRIEVVVDISVEVGILGSGDCGDGGDGGDGGGGGLADKETGLNPVFPNRSGMACRASSF